MPEYDKTRFQPRLAMDRGSHLRSLSRPFRNHNDPTYLSFSATFKDVLTKRIVIKRTFGDKNIFRSRAERHFHGNISRLIAHYFDNKNAFHAVGRIPDLVDRFKCRINGGMTTDCLISPMQIIIYRTRQPDRWDAKFLIQCQGATVRTVPPNHH